MKEATKAARYKGPIPLGTRVKLSEHGLTLEGPKYRGFDENTRGTVVLGKVYKSPAFLAVLVDGSDRIWEGIPDAWERE